MILQKNKNTLNLYSFLSLALLLLFIGIALSLVFSRGICCGDDAYLALIAKNLANGLGYTSTIQPLVSRYTMQPYDPLVGTGPTIILPASLFIGTFGNTYWAPGLANITFWSSLLICIGLFLRKQNNGAGLLLFTCSFLFLAYSLMTYHFEHWYALLGEIPATLLVLLGVLSFLSRDTRLNQVLSGVFFALAVQAKLLTLVAFLVFLGVQILVLFPGQSDSFFIFLKKSAYRICFVIMGFLIPFAIFESWKLFVMGPSGYIENWGQHLKYAGKDGARLNQSSLMSLYDERTEILRLRFGILLQNVGLMLIFAWLMLKKDLNLKRLFFVLLSMIVMYSVWWIFLSIGRPRYFIICLILLIFAISLPLLSTRPKSYMFLYFALIVLFSSTSWARFTYPFEKLEGKYFVPTIQTQGLVSTSRILSQDIDRKDKEQIATQWWATAADLEYMMETPLNFTTYRDDILRKRNSFWLAINTQFIVKDDTAFVDLLEGCTEIQKKSVYIIARCEVKASQ